MADDTLTINQLRQAVIDAAFDSLAGRLDVGDKLDALIAAVRAEERRAVDEHGQYKNLDIAFPER